MQLAHWLLQLKKTKLILVFYLSVIPVVVVAPVFRGFFSGYSGFLFSRKNNFVTTLSLKPCQSKANGHGSLSSPRATLFFAQY